MTNQYVTNPSVRTLLADQIKHERAMLHRHLDNPSCLAYWKPEYMARIQGFRLMAIGVQGALERGELKAVSQ